MALYTVYKVNPMIKLHYKAYTANSILNSILILTHLFNLAHNPCPSTEYYIQSFAF